VLRKLLLISSCILISISSAQAKLPDFTDLVEEVSPAVVKINSISSVEQSSRQFQGQLPDIFRDLFEPRGRPQAPARKVQSSGSGFVISNDGYILTNHHVVDQADEIQVLFADRSEYKAEVIGTDRRSDLALLKIEAKNLRALPFANSDELQVGEWVLAIGSPFGLDYSVTAGIVSAKGRSLPNEQRENYVPFIQTDVAINPGNSGGPLFNLDGEVVGINSQIFSRSGGSIGLSFSIPSAVALSVVDQLKKTGSVRRGWLGVAIQDINKPLAESLELDKPQGALINSVEPGSPADRGGIEPGDVIISLNDQSIIDADDLPHVVGMLAPDTKVLVEVIRQGKRKTLNIKVGVLDGDSLAASNSSGGDRLGLVGQQLDDEELRALQLRGGIVVNAVEPDSAAATAGLRVGDILVQLGYSRIDDMQQYRQVIAELPENTPILVRFYRQGWAISRTIVID
jgi:serine protease Do